MTEESRLERIEAKIDQLSDAMVSLARAEEKLISIEKQNYNHYERMNKMSQKIDDLESRTSDNTRAITLINRVSWTLVAALITFVVTSADKILM